MSFNMYLRTRSVPTPFARQPKLIVCDGLSYLLSPCVELVSLDSYGWLGVACFFTSSVYVFKLGFSGTAKLQMR